MAGKREQLETLNMWGQKLTREEGLTNTDKDNIHKDLALINERFNMVRKRILNYGKCDYKIKVRRNEWGSNKRSTC